MVKLDANIIDSTSKIDKNIENIELKDIPKFTPTEGLHIEESTNKIIKPQKEIEISTTLATTNVEISIPTIKEYEAY